MRLLFPVALTPAPAAALRVYLVARTKSSRRPARNSPVSSSALPPW